MSVARAQTSNQQRLGPVDVVIVGLGPVGAVAACWLGHFGIKALVIEKSPKIWDIPRAVALDHEIMRVFQNLGVAQDVLPHTAPFPASQHFGAQGQLIRRVDMVPPPYPQGYTPSMVFTQPAVEAVLRDHVASYSNVTVWLGPEVVSVKQNANEVSLDVRMQNGTVATARAAYVIACDGASSPVRQMLNLRLDDLGFDEPWMVVDLLVHEHALDKLPKTAAQYCDPSRPATFIIGPKNHRRWELMLSPGEDPRALERHENVWKLLSPWLEPSDGSLWRASCYRFHALVADRWRDGRVFLAGDAAHQQPPFIGQGMCQGIRDVTNLCWKLKAVLQKGAGDDLLDTYGEERELHVRTLTTRIKAIGHHICIRDPEAARRRDEELLKQGGGSAPVITRQEIVPPLQTGLLASSDDTAKGTLFPQPRILTHGGEQLLDEIAVHGWLIVLDGRRVSSADVEESWMNRKSWIKPLTIGGDGLRECDGIMAKWFDQHRCTAAIVRPDHYVYGIAATVAEISRLTQELSRTLYRGVTAMPPRRKTQEWSPAG
jgi:3-(3-hydroxy-phenyl)propionate hydroxylase